MIHSKFTLAILMIAVFTMPICFANSVIKDAHPIKYPKYPVPSIAPGVDPALVKKGEYLVKMGDCIACHTNSERDGKTFAGGLPFDTPFGTFYSQNITPDKETGIGNWTDAEFIRALREGVNPNGQNYYPVFPYVYFNRLSDDDILAIKAYLQSIPAVKQKNRPNKVPFPFSWRFLQGGWKVLFFDFHKGQYKPDPTKSAKWNRGAYIVNGLGHCGMCHSPLNIFGAENLNKRLGGAFVNGYFAPNITSAALSKEKVSNIVKVFNQYEMLGGAGQVQGPMAEVDHDSLRYLKVEDLSAIAVYLKTVKPVKEKKMDLKGNDAGKEIYESKCSVCHASGAAGAPILGNVKDWEPRIKQGMNILYDHALNGFNSMPKKGTCMSCTDEQVKAAVDYLVDNSKTGSSEAGPKLAPTVAPAPDTSIQLGANVYKAKCAACHDTGILNAPIPGDIQAWKPLLAKGIDVLFINTIKGYEAMPAKGGCKTCTNAEVEAAVKYMANKSANNGNYSLW